jgi:ribosomal protein L37AE/L43A
VALQPARVGDIVIEVVCKCGTTLVKPNMVDQWKCRECHRSGTTGFRRRVEADTIRTLASWEEA